MASLFTTGRVADLVVGLMLLEYGVLALLYRRTGRGVPPPELAASLAAGAALLLALRSSLMGEPWRHLAVWLLLALCAHLLYVRLRWNRGRVC